MLSSPEMQLATSISLIINRQKIGARLSSHTGTTPILSPYFVYIGFKESMPYLSVKNLGKMHATSVSLEYELMLATLNVYIYIY